jgi:glycosyltransferase involved in cell wall biosynthesis
MPRLLAVCTLPPWPIRDGYSLRAANLLARLARRWDITLLAPGDTPPGVARHVTLALAGPGLSYPWRFDNRPLLAALGTLLPEARPDRALIWPGAESAWLDAAPRTPAVAGQVPAVLDMIDCNPREFWTEARAARGRDRLRPAREAAVAALHARRAVRGFAATVCVGEADAAWMARLGGRAVHMVPNGVALPEASGREDPRPTVVFAGTLDYPPNLDAVAFAAAEVWPRLRALVPEARWVVAGRRPVAAVRALHGRDGIEIRADVADMAGVLHAAWVALAPMRTGVGIKNKVLEAWACARPVVLTRRAMNGLALPPGHAGLVQDGAAGLADAAAALLRDGDARRRLGCAARATVAREFTWEEAVGRVDALLRLPGRLAIRSELNDEGHRG